MVDLQMRTVLAPMLACTIEVLFNDEGGGRRCLEEPILDDPKKIDMRSVKLQP